MLAEFAAQVIKVEPPGKGDAMRQWGEADRDTGEPLWWNLIARNKQSLTLDLRQTRGQELLHELASQDDVIISSCARYPVLGVRGGIARRRRAPLFSLPPAWFVLSSRLSSDLPTGCREVTPAERM